MRLSATHILVKPDTKDKTTPGGIFIPDLVKQTVNRGKVVLTGPGIEGKPMKLSEGNYVQYKHSAGLMWDERWDKQFEGCLLMRMEDVQFVIGEDNQIILP